MYRNTQLPMAQGSIFARQHAIVGSYDGSHWWTRTPRNTRDESFDNQTAQRPLYGFGVPFTTPDYRYAIYGASHKPEGVYDPRGPHNRYYNNEIVNLSGYEGYDYINPYTINAARYAALTISPRKPPYQLQNSTPQAIALNVVASRSVWRKWGVR